MMGTNEVSCADGTHDATLVDKAAPIIQDESQFGHVSHLPSGRWELFKVIGALYPL